MKLFKQRDVLTMSMKNCLTTFLFCLCAVSTAQASSRMLKTDSHTLEITGGMYEGKLSLDGKVIYANPDQEMLYLEFAFPDSPLGGDIFLLQTSSGGNACPANYRFVTVAEDGKAIISDSFGTCSDLYEIKYNPKELSVSVPKMKGNGNVTYLYVKGQAKEQK